MHTNTQTRATPNRVVSKNMRVWEIHILLLWRYIQLSTEHNTIEHILFRLRIDHGTYNDAITVAILNHLAKQNRQA